MFSSFSKQYLELSTNVNRNQYQYINDNLAPQDSLPKENKERRTEINEIQKKQFELGLQIQKLILQYYNVFAFLVLPIYTLMAYLVFYKPYNFGEHLIINTYIQGFSFILMTIFVLLSLIISPDIYFYNILAMAGLYLYVYSKLYQLSYIKIFLKFLKFLGIFIGLATILFLMGVVIGVIMMTLLDLLK